MKLNTKKLGNSCIRDIKTSVGTFRVSMPCGVYNNEHLFNGILNAIKNYQFKPTPEDASRKQINGIADENAIGLQNALNEAAKCGTGIPQAYIDVFYADRVVSIS